MNWSVLLIYENYDDNDRNEKRKGKKKNGGSDNKTTGERGRMIVGVGRKKIVDYKGNYDAKK